MNSSFEKDAALLEDKAENYSDSSGPSSTRVLMQQPSKMLILIRASFTASVGVNAETILR